MGLRFKKSVRICKGVYINIGKTGTSLSVGERGARYTIHSSGKKQLLLAFQERVSLILSQREDKNDNTSQVIMKDGEEFKLSVKD